MDKYTQPSKAEDKIELGNSIPEPDSMKREPLQERKAESPDSLKSGTVGHEEDTFTADTNAFGQGKTTSEKVKSEWSHLE